MPFNRLHSEEAGWQDLSSSPEKLLHCYNSWNLWNYDPWKRFAQKSASHNVWSLFDLVELLLELVKPDVIKKFLLLSAYSLSMMIF